MSINRNKRSIVIDLKREEGREIIYKLIRETDIVIENFRVGVAEKLGIDYNTLKKYRNDIIYCSIKGFGSKGPYTDKPSYDIIIQAMSGLMSTTGEEGRPPIRVSFALADIFTALYAVNSILALLYHRKETGEGGYIEANLLDSMIFSMSYIPMIYLMTGKIPRRYGSGHPSIVPYQAFKCKDDKYLIIAVGNDRHWMRLCKAIDREDLVDDERFKTNPDRVKNRDKLIPILEKIFLERDREEWMKILDKAKVPYGPVYNLDEVFQDEYVKYSKIVMELIHDKIGAIKQLTYPVYINGYRLKPKNPPPTLGNETVNILRELGYTDKEIKRMMKDRIVCCE